MIAKILVFSEDGSTPSFKIHLMESMTELVGKTELDLEAEEGATLFDIFTEVEKDYGEIVKNKITTADGDFHPYVLVSVNGTDFRALNGMDTRLNEGDEILLGMLITGG